MQSVVLVTESDEMTGVAEKMEAHQKGLLHRAFSIFIFNSQGEMLLQQRAMSKYHSAGLWTNACCSHPGPGEDVEQSARIRLKEEMGFDTPVQKIFEFIYRAGFDNGLTEHELDHVFTGIYDGPVDYNPEEVMNYAYRPIGQIIASLSQSPHEYTAWFRIAFPRIQEWWNTQFAR
jgi:isopentenyl-diphosphate delta-isomerase, type 1